MSTNTDRLAPRRVFGTWRSLVPAHIMHVKSMRRRHLAASLCYYLRQGGYVMRGVCLPGCLSVRLLVTLRNKKLSYPQRKCASNVAILYGAKSISIRNRAGIDRTCDRQTTYVAPSVDSIQNAKFDAQHYGSVAVDSLRPVFNTLVPGEPLNTGPRNLASRNYKNAVSYGVDPYLRTIISFCQGARV